MPSCVVLLGKFATFIHYMRYSLISCTTHPTKGCSWALHIKASVYPFRSLFLIHLYVLFLSLSYISLANFPFSIFSFFFFSFLEFFRVNCSSCAIALLGLTASSNGSILFLTYHPRPFSSLFTLFSHPISHLPPFLLGTYNRATSLLGCNSLFIVINFLFFLSISCSSFLLHLSIPAPFLKMETAQVFSAVI